MHNAEFKELVKKDLYQVFLFTSSATVPISFAVHPWFIVNDHGVLSRWEILHFKNKGAPELGHLHVNFLKPTQGMNSIPFLRRYRWKASLRGFIEGEQGSVAQKVVARIIDSPKAYPHLRKYAFTGPNSNTYAQWLLDQFPEFKTTLPAGSFGKNYHQCH